MLIELPACNMLGQAMSSESQLKGTSHSRVWSRRIKYCKSIREDLTVLQNLSMAHALKNADKRESYPEHVDPRHVGGRPLNQNKRIKKIQL